MQLSHRWYYRGCHVDINHENGGTLSSGILFICFLFFVSLSSNCLFIVPFVGLEQFLWDYRCESRPVDVLLALGGNDLLRSGIAGVTLGLDDWKKAVDLYSRGRGHYVPSTVLVCTLPWCVYFSFFLFNFTWSLLL